MQENQIFTIEQAAEICGVSVEFLLSFMKKHNLLDENGKPTKKALDEGLLVLKPKEPVFHKV